MPQFLSHEWIEAAHKIREEHEAEAGAPAHQVKMNLVITGCPDGVGTDGSVNAHMDTSEGTLQMGEGHLDAPELTVTVDYDTAKAIFVDQNPQAGMQAFMAGKVKVQGDMTKLMAMQQGAPTEGQVKIAAAIKDITE